MTLRVTILALAQIDAESIYEWILQRSQAGAAAWYAAFETAVGKVADEADRLRAGAGVRRHWHSLAPATLPDASRQAIPSRFHRDGERSAHPPCEGAGPTAC